MNKEKVFCDANSLLNSVLDNFNCVNNNNNNCNESINQDSPLLKRRKITKQEIAYEKFTESTLNDNEFDEPIEVEMKGTKSDKNINISIDILPKIQNIENKLATIESIWANALKQLTALHELAKSVETSTKIDSSIALLGDHKILVVLPTLPVKTIDELIEFDKAVSHSKDVVKTVKRILEDGDESEYHDSHTKFIKWNISKLIRPEVANDIFCENQLKFQLKNSAFIKIIIKRINMKFPMLSYTYIVEKIIAVLVEFRSINNKLNCSHSTNICTEMS